MADQCEWPARLRGSLNARLHWRARAKICKAERATAALLCGARMSRPAFPCVVTLTRIGPRQLDDDNVATAFKAVRDGVADWLRVDDGDTSKVTWRYAQERGAYGVRVEVEHVA